MIKMLQRLINFVRGTTEKAATGSDDCGFVNAKLAVSRPGWTPKRCHLTALRKMEKTFLRDLWLAWRTAVNMAVVPPYFPRM